MIASKVDAFFGTLPVRGRLRADDIRPYDARHFPLEWCHRSLADSACGAPGSSRPTGLWFNEPLAPRGRQPRQQGRRPEGANTEISSGQEAWIETLEAFNGQ